MRIQVCPECGSCYAKEQECPNSGRHEEWANAENQLLKLAEDIVKHCPSLTQLLLATSGNREMANLNAKAESSAERAP